MNTNNMYQENIEKIETKSTYQEIQKLLESGYTWFKRNDLGYSSIQEHFKATDVQIAAIRQHPRLKDLKTVAQVFVIVDDTKDNETTVHTKEPVYTGSTQDNAQRSNISVGSQTADMDTVSENDDSLSAFANL